MPPGSAKSTYSSKLFPAWYLGRNPNKLLIGASHSASLANDFSGETRKFIREFGNILNISISAPDTIDHWGVSNGGEYKCFGVGGSPTGRRADGILADDLVSGAEAAASDLQRKKVWNWFKKDLRTRLKPSGFAIVIMTRWHEEDLAGKILEEDGDKDWVVVNIPMEAEDNDVLGRAKGELLWAEYFGGSLAIKEAKRDPKTWSSLYQGKPAPDGGDFFKEEWLHDYDVAPDLRTLAIYGASDFAVSEGRGDYTVHAIYGVDKQARIYVLDLWRGRTTPDIWISTLLDLQEKWKTVMWGFEKGQILLSIGKPLLQECARRGVFLYRRAIASTLDKSVRAQGIRAQISSAGLYLPRKAEWRTDFINELMVFPSGRHDDVVDTLSLLGQIFKRDGADIAPPSTPTKQVFARNEAGHLVSNVTVQEALRLEAIKTIKRI